MSAVNPLDEIRPLVNELLKQGHLDGFLIRHHQLEASSYVETAIQRLVSTVARKLGVDAREIIEAEECDDHRAVNEIVAAQLIETANEIIDAEPVQAFLDQILGKHNVLPRAVANDVLDQGRKKHVRKIQTEPVDDHDAIAEEEPEESEAVEEIPGPLDRARITAALAKMNRKGLRPTRKNLAKTLGYTDRHLRRLLPAKK